MPLPETILFFDSECLLCQRSVQWLLKRDTAARLHFAPQEGTTFQQAKLAVSGLPVTQGVVLLHQTSWYTKSEASLVAASLLPAPWKYLSALRFLPLRLRNAVYNFVARNRYRWFGKTQHCMVPTTDKAKQFLP